jgi:hypothetical protein
MILKHIFYYNFFHLSYSLDKNNKLSALFVFFIKIAYLTTNSKNKKYINKNNINENIGL